MLGTYEDQELRLASFLHELGHIRTPDCADEYEEEQRAWQWAFRRARKLGLKFRRGTFAWCRAQLETYRRAGGEKKAGRPRGATRRSFSPASRLS